MVSDPHWKDIVKEEKRHCVYIKKTFQGQVLGYVTPVSPLISEYNPTRERFLRISHLQLSRLVFQVPSSPCPADVGRKSPQFEPGAPKLFRKRVAWLQVFAAAHQARAVGPVVRLRSAD